MNPEIALLNNYLVLGALLVGLGVAGFICRRNMIVMFLSAEIVLQGVSLSLAAWGRFHNNFQGQTLVLMIVAIAACEAALALALVLALFQRRGTLDAVAWHQLREADQPPPDELPDEPESPPPQWPRLSPAGLRPDWTAEETEFRTKV
jgi:NADH-quinone oxidoreductase subunit K